MRATAWLAALFGFGLVCCASAATAADDSPAERARLERGRQVRDVLIATIDRAYENDREWPGELVRPAGTAIPPLTYIRPVRFSDPGIAETSASTRLVVHEPFEQHPAGVWVGYADGHLEFAETPDDLAASKAQAGVVDAAHNRAHGLVGPDPEPAAATTQPAPPPAGTLTLKLVDADGKPVAGARVGAFCAWGDRRREYPRPAFATEHPDGREPLVSGDDGTVLLRAERVFGSAGGFAGKDVAPLYVLHESRGLVALDDVSRAQFSTPAGDVKTVRLQPACRVYGVVTCVGLPGRDIQRSSVRTFQPGRFWLQNVSCSSNGPAFEMLLPPGDHVLEFRGSGCDAAERIVRIESGRRELKVQVDLPPLFPSTLLGRPAPEFTRIKAWKNGGPVTLEGLRGKVVLLDFWGYWCGPCVGAMPALMKLHDTYKDQGLVIVGVHDDSAESVAEMDDRLRTVRAQMWDGRDLPFLVALDGGGRTRVAGRAMTTTGATTAAYGITSFPTTLLVGRDGTLLAEIEPTHPDAAAQIEAALAK